MCKRDPKPRIPGEREREIIAMREAKKTYREIGDHFGLCQERVRQLLHLSGRSDLCHNYWMKTSRLHVCMICRRERQMTGTEYNGAGKTCGIPCHRILQSRSMGGDLEHLGPEAVRLREGGMTYRQIGERLLPNAKKPSQNAYSLITKWENRFVKSRKPRRWVLDTKTDVLTSES